MDVCMYVFLRCCKVYLSEFLYFIWVCLALIFLTGVCHECRVCGVWLNANHQINSVWCSSEDCDSGFSSFLFVCLFTSFTMLMVVNLIFLLQPEEKVCHKECTVSVLWLSAQWVHGLSIGDCSRRTLTPLHIITRCFLETIMWWHQLAQVISTGTQVWHL